MLKVGRGKEEKRHTRKQSKENTYTPTPMPRDQGGDTIIITMSSFQIFSIFNNLFLIIFLTSCFHFFLSKSFPHSFPQSFFPFNFFYNFTSKIFLPIFWVYFLKISIPYFVLHFFYLYIVFTFGYFSVKEGLLCLN